MVVVEKKIDEKWDVVFVGVIVSDPVIIGESLCLLDPEDNKYLNTSIVTNIYLSDRIIYVDTISGSEYRLINLDFDIKD